MRSYLILLTHKEPDYDELDDIFKPHMESRKIDSDIPLWDCSFTQVEEYSGLVADITKKPDFSKILNCWWFIDIDRSITCRYDALNNYEENKDFDKIVLEKLRSSPDCWLSVFLVHH